MFLSIKQFCFRSLFLPAFIGLVLTPCQAASNIPVISPQYYYTARLMGEALLLLDVCPSLDEFTRGHIPGALHVSTNDLDRTVFTLPPNQKIIVTCGVGNWKVCPDAMSAAQKLAQRGFTNVSVLRLEDGVISWTLTPLEQGPGLSVPNVFTPSAQNPSNFVLTLINPESMPFPEDVANFTHQMTETLPQLKIVTITSSSAEGKHLIEEMGLRTLPVAFFDPSFQNAAVFSQWLNSGWVKQTPGGQEFTVTPKLLQPQIYVNRPREANELSLFIMSQCPFGIEALSQTLQAIRDGKVPKDVKLTVHYLVTRLPEAIFPNPPADLKGDPASFFKSLHGTSELEEDVRELVILKYFPERFSAYFLERAKQPAGSPWENAATVAGLDPTFISQKYSEEGATLLQKEYDLSDEMGISTSPTFLWENTIRVNKVAHLKDFPPLKNLDIKLSGSCTHK
jgi:rhodanese-related sulfurtransferase